MSPSAKAVLWLPDPVERKCERCKVTGPHDARDPGFWTCLTCGDVVAYRDAIGLVRPGEWVLDAAADGWGVVVSNDGSTITIGFDSGLIHLETSFTLDGWKRCSGGYERDGYRLTMIVNAPVRAWSLE